MTPAKFLCISAIKLVATLAITVQLAAQVKYTVTDVLRLGGTFIQASTINNRD